MDNVVKQTELLEKTGVYDEDLKRRFALTLKRMENRTVQRALQGNGLRHWKNMD